MLSDEEKQALEQAGSNITRGNDIESAMMILEKCALDGVIFTRGRINVFKIAVRQILNFLKEYKDKGYLDVVREKVKANETVEKQSKEIEYQKEKRENQKKELAILNAKQVEFNKLVNTVNSYKGQFKRQQKEIEELKETLKCTQNSWYEDTKIIDKIKAKIEEIDEVLKGQLIEKIRVYFEAQKEVLHSFLEKE